jgi:hypothetical protein
MTRKEIRTITIKYGKKQLNVSMSLEDTVTVRIGDWYFEGEVKKVKEKQDPTSILNYNSPSGSEKETIHLS